MKKYFRTKEGKLINIVEHTLEQIGLHSNLKIYVGTDSQDYGKITRYVTTIVYRYRKNGAHFIYYLEEVPVIRDMFVRLYNEGSRTIETAELLRQEIPISFEALEFDYNDIHKTLSSRVIQSLRGWTKGLNMNAHFKSGGQIATKASDHICRHPSDYGYYKEAL